MELAREVPRKSDGCASREVVMKDAHPGSKVKRGRNPNCPSKKKRGKPGEGRGSRSRTLGDRAGIG